MKVLRNKMYAKEFILFLTSSFFFFFLEVEKEKEEEYCSN